jgi:hypothetical protein
VSAPIVPRALKPFVKALEPFHPTVRADLQKIVPRLSMMLGPLTRRTVNEGAPDGFSGLDRKGPYERLVASEWAMALEVPEEFIRRAAMGEHLFYAPQKKEPAGSLRSLVLVDAGPDQLGAPRLVHLAAIVVAIARAHEAKAELGWAPLSHGAPRVSSTLDAVTVRLFLDARRGSPLELDMFEHWDDVLSHFEGDVDVTLVGGPTLLRRFVRDRFEHLAHARLLIVETALDALGTLDVTLHQEGARPKQVRFATPAEEHLVRTLRDPLDDTQGHEPLTVDARPYLGLCTASAARRLFVRTGGGIAALPMVNSPRQKLAPARELPLLDGDVLVACGIDGKRPIAVVHRGEQFSLVTTGERIPLDSRDRKPLVLIEQVRPLLPVSLPAPVDEDTERGVWMGALTSPVPRVFVDDQGTAFAVHPVFRRMMELTQPLACPPTPYSARGRLWLEIGRADDEPTQRGSDVIRRFDAAWPREVLLGAASAGGTVPGCVAHHIKGGGWRLWSGQKRVDLGGITESVLCATFEETRLGGAALVAARSRTLHLIGHGVREKVSFASDVVAATPDPHRPVVFVGCADGSVWALFLKSLTKAPIARSRA